MGEELLGHLQLIRSLKTVSPEDSEVYLNRLIEALRKAKD